MQSGRRKWAILGHLKKNSKNVLTKHYKKKKINPLLSDKSINCDKIHLNELINSESKTAEVLNNFFSNVVKNLKIPEYVNLNANFENVKDRSSL